MIGWLFVNNQRASYFQSLGLNAKRASRIISSFEHSKRNEILERISHALTVHKEVIFQQNALDIERAQIAHAENATIDRLKISPSVLAGIIESISIVQMQPDPLSVELEKWEISPGLLGRKISVPIGVIGIIYEGRPNVTVDAAVLAIKTGNAILLRGSSTAIESNKALVSIIQDALAGYDIPREAVQLVEDTSREGVLDFLTLKDFLDVVIPRGSRELIQFVVDNAKVPVIETGAGVCHLYVDSEANISMAKDILLNGKVQRPSVCNALETLLLSRGLSHKSQKQLISSLLDEQVTCYGCADTKLLDNRVLQATEKNWETEYQNRSISIKIVNTVDDAIDHISKFGTKHSECIVTDNLATASHFQKQVDASVVYHNASTRFTDGFQFGFGAELGISTQKLHARGPMGLKELTSYKYLVTGEGHCRVA